MQKGRRLYANIKANIDGSIAAIQSLGEKDGQYFEDFCKQISSVPPTEFPMTSKYNNIHDVKDSEKQRIEFSSVRKALVKNVVEHLQCWFPDSEIMNSFSVLDPKGNHDNMFLDKLIEHFGSAKKDKLGKINDQLIDPVKTRIEYGVVQGLLSSQASDFETFYKVNIHEHIDTYPNIGCLYAIALTCPCTSVECERGFTKYNLIKTNNRNMLTVSHVNELSVISIEGPSISQFDFEVAFKNWVTKNEGKAFHASFLKETKVTNSESRSETNTVENETQAENDCDIELIEKRIGALQTMMNSLFKLVEAKKS